MTNPLALARSNNEQLQELQRFAEFGRLSASLLHEISNPLTAISLHLGSDKPLSSAQLKRARHNLQLMERYVEAARQQLRQAGQVGSFTVRRELEQVRRVLGPYAKRAGVRLVIETGANYQIWGDPVKFQQILANLVANAVDAYRPLRDQGQLPPEPTVSIRLSQHDPWLVIEVRDEGIGMTSAELKHIYEAFYTTKVQAGYGLGIGLTAVKQYVEQDFGGSLQVSSAIGHGSCFTAHLRQRPAAKTGPKRWRYKHAGQHIVLAMLVAVGLIRG